MYGEHKVARAEAEFGPVAGSYEANENLRAWHRRQGDFGGAIRTVLHYAYPHPGAAPGARAALICELAMRGFTAVTSTMKGGLTFRHDVAPATDAFDRTTADVAALLAAYDWAYDAWESAPVSDPALIYWQQIEGLSRTAAAR